LEVGLNCLSPISVQRHATSDGCILFACIVAHSWYMTCATVCFILSVYCWWQWTVRHTNYSFGKGNTQRKKRH